jgi:hypothetical protein
MTRIPPGNGTGKILETLCVWHVPQTLKDVKQYASEMDSIQHYIVEYRPVAGQRPRNGQWA